ncbi:Thiol methyltransferase [Aspergillus sp. HF37]|nr:Thiol methyltransferase [Aspergillus sp. HF37]
MPDPNALDPKSIHEVLAQHQGEDYVNGWAAVWDKCESLPWDRGFANPALEDALTERTTTIGGPIGQDTRRKRALVPGCGRGVDVLLLASFGYDAYGLECSPAAVEACKQEEATNGDKYPVRDAEVGQGKIAFVQGDFFSDDWLEALGLPQNSFDLVYDYTFFCALNPSMRPQWALRQAQLLAPSPAGNLICLEFPRHKDPSLGGPPFFSASEAYLEHLSHPGEDIPYDDKGFVKSDRLRAPSDNGLERVLHWEPTRTHDVGKGKDGGIHDRVSVWRRRT